MSRLDKYRTINEDGKNTVSLWKMPASIGLLMLIIPLSINLIVPRDKIDQRSGCMTGVPPSEIAIFLLDRSDKFTEAERNDVETAILEVAKSLPKNGMLRVMAFNKDDLQQPQTHLLKCSPGPSNLGLIKALYRNTRIHQKNWEKALGNPLKDKLDELLRIKAENYSPIIESLMEIAKIRELRTTKGNKTIYLYSDMIQNSIPNKRGWSMLSAGNLKRSFDRSKLSKRKFGFPDRVTVRAYWIERETYVYLQRRTDFKEFWQSLFEKSGAEYSVVGPYSIGDPLVNSQT